MAVEPLKAAVAVGGGMTSSPAVEPYPETGTAPAPEAPGSSAREDDFFAHAPKMVPVFPVQAVANAVAASQAARIPDMVADLTAPLALSVVAKRNPPAPDQGSGEIVQVAPPVVPDARTSSARVDRPKKRLSVPGTTGKSSPAKPLLICAALGMVAIILICSNHAQLLSGFSDQGIWLIKWKSIGMQDRNFYVQLQRQGNTISGTPVLPGGDSFNGFIYNDGTISLTQKQSFARLHPAKLAGAGDLQGGTFEGKIVAGGFGNWSARRMTWMQLMFQPPSAEWLRDQFAKTMLGFLLLSCVLVYASLKLFGPNGYVNIKSRKQYVPTRYKAEHARMLSQYGKAITAGSLPLGTRVDWAPWHFAARTLSLPAEVRRKDPHILAVGGTGKGKTRLLAGMAMHDIECGDRAVIIVDPDGALSDLVARRIAAHADCADIVKRLRIIDGTREEPLSFNPIREPVDGQLQNMASSVVAGFRAIYTPLPGAQQTWTQQTAHILRSALLLLSVNGRNLSDLPILLTDNDERDILLQKVEARKDESAELSMICESWSRYRKLARSEHWLDWVEPILNRVQPVLGDPKLNAIIATDKNDVDFRKVLENQGIVILKLPRARFGDHASLVGSLLVASVQNAALSLSSEDESRFPASIYLDDFSHFIDKEMFQQVTGDTRRYGLGLVCAARSLQDIPEDYRNLVMNNVGTLATFACAPKDAEALGKQMFRVDGRQAKQRTIGNIFNAVNTTISNYDLISDEEKLNIDRIIGQDDRTYFCYRVGSVAGCFNLRAPEFREVERDSVDVKLLAQAYRPYKDKQVKKGD